MKAFTTLIVGVLALLAVALFASSALAADRPNDRTGMLGPGAVVAVQVVHPNDQAGPLGTGAVALEGQPAYWQGERDFGAYTTAGEVVAPVVVPVATESPSGWDWGDTLIVAAVVAGVAVAAAALALTMRGHGGHRPIPH